MATHACWTLIKLSIQHVICEPQQIEHWLPIRAGGLDPTTVMPWPISQSRIASRSPVMAENVRSRYGFDSPSMVSRSALVDRRGCQNR